MEPSSGIVSESGAEAPVDLDGARVVETLRWLCLVPSPTGDEGPICDALVERLARAVRELVNEPERARAMGRAARSAALARFGLGRFLADWDVLFAEMVGR